MPETKEKYPGDDASAKQVLRLANYYRKAAEHLLTFGMPGDALSRAPFRLTAIHSIELYLNALLLHGGLAASEIRGMQHDLALRAKLAAGGGLSLRTRTAAHLSDVAERREYLAARYGIGAHMRISQVNRLSATLNEVSKKVIKALAEPSSRVR